MGNLRQLELWFNWERTGDNSGAQCAAVWKEVMLSIDWSDMSCCCDQPITLFRWTVEGVLQISIDGGETYTDAPEQDPRNNSPVYPPVEGASSDEKSCIAATGMSLLIEEQVVGNLTDDMSRYTLGQLIHDWVTTLVETSNPFEALINIATNQIFALLISAVRAALTTEVYHTLTCIFLVNMASDLSFDSVAWEAVRSAILSGITGIAGVFLEHLVFLLGAVGLTNLARSQAATEGDCDDCLDDKRVFVWDELAAESTEIFADEDGIYTAPSGVVASSGHYVCSIFFVEALPVPTHWKCYPITVIDNPTEFGVVQYRCSDYTPDALSSCNAQYTFHSDIAPFSITFTVGDLCGEH
jgi:hypothetical protein